MRYAVAAFVVLCVATFVAVLLAPVEDEPQQYNAG